MPISKTDGRQESQSCLPRVARKNDSNTPKQISNKDYEQAFNELATFLLSQYKKKKQADLTSEPNINAGQIANNIF